MEIEQDYIPNNNNNYQINPNANINNYYHNENILFNNINNIYVPFFNKTKIAKKRNYNESLNSTNKILIKEKELKYLLDVINNVKLKLDSNNNFLEKKREYKEINKDNNKNDNNKKLENTKVDYKLDYSLIDLNDVIFQLYQSNNLSLELKKFLLKKLIDNAIKVERTFQNYFNINNMPNKK